MIDISLIILFSLVSIIFGIVLWLERRETRKKELEIAEKAEKAQESTIALSSKTSQQ